jgi:hypothetical protein
MLERLSIALLCAAAASAQEPEQDPAVLLTTALQRLKTAENVSASVEVKHEPPEAKAPAQGQGGMVIVMGTKIVGEDPPFEGRVEACRAADGTAVLLSANELPGFALYVGENRMVERTTFEEERFSLDQLKAELCALLDPGTFAQRIFDAKLKPTRDAATGVVTFRGKVDRDIVPAAVGEMAFLQARVLDVHATLVVTPDGSLASAAMKITRSDPSREMRRGGARKIVIEGGGPPGALPPADDDKKHIVGGSTTYTLTFGEGGLSERAKAFKAEVERLLRPAEHGDLLPPEEERK